MIRSGPRGLALVCLIVNAAALVVNVAAGHWPQALGSVAWGLANIVWLLVIEHARRTREISRRTEAVALEALKALTAAAALREEENRALRAEKEALEARP